VRYNHHWEIQPPEKMRRQPEKYGEARTKLIKRRGEIKLLGKKTRRGGRG
jgi:hypothetical protein